jgi:hypothetical protein
MAMYGGFLIDRHFLGNVIRGITMSKVVVHVITLSQEKATYIKIDNLI